MMAIKIHEILSHLHIELRNINFHCLACLWSIRSKLNEIGSFALITMLEEEAPIVNKDLLLSSCSFGERGNKIFVSTTIDLELEDELNGTKIK